MLNLEFEFECTNHYLNFSVLKDILNKKVLYHGVLSFYKSL